MQIATLPTASPGRSRTVGAAEFSTVSILALQNNYGKEAIISPRDERVTRLHGYYAQGWEGAGVLPDIQKTLGPHWQEIPESPQSYALDDLGEVRQVISFSQETGETRISTIHSPSMIETNHETLIIDREGKVRKESVSAC